MYERPASLLSHSCGRPSKHDAPRETYFDLSDKGPRESRLVLVGDGRLHTLALGNLQHSYVQNGILSTTILTARANCSQSTLAVGSGQHKLLLKAVSRCRKDNSGHKTLWCKAALETSQCERIDTTIRERQIQVRDRAEGRGLVQQDEAVYVAESNLRTRQR